MPSDGRALRWSAGLLPVLIAVWLLLAHGVTPGELAVYAGYLVLGVVGPGLLVARAVLGRQVLLAADLALGAVTGMVLQLAAWFVAVGTGLGGWIRVWVVVVYAAFALTPALRRHWRPGHSERLNPVVAWVLSLSTALVSVWFTGLFASTQPLTGRHEWPFDMYWHLGLVEMFARQVRPEDSQVAGSHLAYHYFSHADMAATSLMTGIDPATVISRLWVLPLVAVTAGLLLAVALELGPPAQPVAAVAAALLATRAGLELVPWLDVPWDNTFAVFSPSQNYSYPFLLLTVLLIARFLRQGGLRTLAPLAVLLLLGSGVKATTLPVVLSGLLLAVAVSVVCRAPWRRAAVLASVAAVALAVGTVVIGAGGSTGSGVQLLSTLRRNAVYHEFIGLSATQARVAGGLVLPGLALPGAALVAALLLWATVLKYLWVLPGAAVLGVRRGQVDPVAWFLLGGGLSGWLLMLLVDQSGLSQVYFLSTGVVLWFLLAAWGLVELWHRATEQHGRVRTTRVVLASSLAAAVLARLLGLLSPERPALDGTAAGLAVVLVPAAVILVAVGAVVLVQARSGGGALGGLALGAGLVAVSIAGTVVLTATPTEAREPGRNAVTAAETSAARWLAERAGAHDVVATNVHCLRPRANAPCDARAFWVSALTRRRVFIGGWAYLDETRAAAARRGPPGVDQPFHDQEAFRLNERLFTDPTPETATELRRRGVTWVFADVRRGEVSDRLAQVAQLVHSTADVDVYRLAPVALPSP